MKLAQSLKSLMKLKGLSDSHFLMSEKIIQKLQHNN